MSYTTLVKRIKTPGANPDVDYDNDGQEWVSVQAYLDYMDGEGAEIPLKKTLVITPQNGQRYEVWNPVSARTFVPKVMGHTHSYDDLHNKPTIPAVNDSEIVFTHDGREVGRMTTNQSAGKTIDVGSGEETVFTAEFLKKVLTCRMNKEVYMTSGSVVSPNMVKYNGLPEPGASSTAWCGAGTEPTAAANTRIIIHNVNVEPWKGRTMTFTIKDGLEFAIASGTVTQSAQWDKPYPQTSDIPWNWHSHNDPVTIEIKDMVSIMIRNSGNTSFNWAYSYTAMWEWLTVEEVTDTTVVKIAPKKLKDDRYVGARIGVLGDSILAGASTKAYKTALDVLVSDYGIVPVPRCIAGSCIAPTSTDYSRDDIRFKNRIEINWQYTSTGYNGAENGANRPYDKSLGVLIYCVNDVLMDKVALDENPFILVTDQQTGCQEWQINTSELNAEGYIASLVELEGLVKAGAGATLSNFFLVGPYKCTWPGAYPMSTTGINPNGDSGEDFIEMQKKLAMIKGWSYLNLLSSQLNTSYTAMSNDRLHPSQEGHQLLGDLLGQMLCGTLLTQADKVFTCLDENETDNQESINILMKTAEVANSKASVELELPLNGYIDAATHQFVESNDYKCSGLVYVRGAKSIEYKTRSLGVSYHMCFYDEAKNSIPALDFPIQNEGVTGVIDLTSQTYADVYYVIMSAYPGGYPPYLRLKGDFDYSSVLNESQLSYKEGYNLFDISRVERGKGLHGNTGEVTDDNQSILSNLIVIPPVGERGRTGNLHFFNLPETTASKRFVQLDADMNVVRGPSDISAANSSAEIGIHADAKYLLFTLVRAMSTLPTGQELQTMYANTIITVEHTMSEYQQYCRNINAINGVGICASSLAGLYKGKKWVVVGDSLTERNGHSAKFYHDYVREDLGLTVVNMGVSGTGYKTRDDVQSPTTEGAFYQRVTLIPRDADVVTIFGSFNDMTQNHTLGTASDTGTTTIGGCINAAIEAIYAINPAMKLGIIAPCPWKEMTPSNTDAAAYVTLLQEICAKNSIPFLDLFHNSGLRPWIRDVRDELYDMDDQTGGDYHGTHPNSKGHELLASKIRVFLQTLI